MGDGVMQDTSSSDWMSQSDDSDRGRWWGAAAGINELGNF